MRLTLPTKIPRSLFEALIQTAGLDGRIKTKPIVDYFRLPTGKTAVLLTLHQPSFTTFDVLAAIADGDLLLPSFEISRLDISLDLVVGSQGSADLLKKYLISRLIPKGLRPSNSWNFRGSTRATSAYLDKDGSRGQVVSIYSDNATKTMGRSPCTHLEWRLIGASTVRRAGLSDLQHLRQLDHRMFWDTRLRLAKPRNSLESAHEHLLALSGSKSKKDMLRQYFDIQLHQWMLPCCENALWDTIWWEAHNNGERAKSPLPMKRNRLPQLGTAAEWLY